MYDHEINAMVDALREQCVLDTHDIEKAAERAKAALRKYWTDRIALTWSTEDVRQTAEDMGLPKTEASCREILHRILHRADADVGVSWETIRNTITDARDLP